MPLFRLSLVLILLGLQNPGWTLEVARDELRQVQDKDVVFVNFEGIPSKVETRAQIAGIGRALASGLQPVLQQRSYFGRYLLIHAVDASVTEGFDADIIIFDRSATVDHIRNVRFILAGYLSAAYGYDERDAALLAEFVTIYNAVYRNNLAYFQGRFKKVVLGHLEPGKAGLGLNYRDWPGNSQIVIPLSGSATAGGGVSAVDTSQLTSQPVIEDLRQTEDLGLDQRRDIVDLQERQVQEEQQALETERARVEEQRQDLANREQALASAQNQQAAATQTRTPEQADTTQPQTSAQDEQERIAQERQNLAAQEERIQAREQALQERQESIQEQREQIAQDQQALINREQPAAAAPSTVLFFVVKEASPEGALALVDVQTGAIVRSAETPLAGSNSVQFGDGRVFVAKVGSGNQLVLLDEATLQAKLRGREEVFPQTSLAVRDNNLYAVIKDGDAWYLGRYDRSLALTVRSKQAVNPRTFIAFKGDALLVQAPGGGILPLSVGEFGQ